MQNINRCNKKRENKRKIIKFEFRVALYGKYAIIPHVDRAPVLGNFGASPWGGKIPDTGRRMKRQTTGNHGTQSHYIDFVIINFQFFVKEKEGETTEKVNLISRSK